MYNLRLKTQCSVVGAYNRFSRVETRADSLYESMKCWKEKEKKPSQDKYKDEERPKATEAFTAVMHHLNELSTLNIIYFLFTFSRQFLFDRDYLRKFSDLCTQTVSQRQHSTSALQHCKVFGSKSSFRTGDLMQIASFPLEIRIRIENIIKMLMANAMIAYLEP